jgi:hypothetical protein
MIAVPVFAGPCRAKTAAAAGEQVEIHDNILILNTFAFGIPFASSRLKACSLLSRRSLA